MSAIRKICTCEQGSIGLMNYEQVECLVDRDAVLDQLPIVEENIGLKWYSNWRNKMIMLKAV